MEADAESAAGFGVVEGFDFSDLFGDSGEHSSVILGLRMRRSEFVCRRLMKISLDHKIGAAGLNFRFEAPAILQTSAKECGPSERRPCP